MTKPPKPPQPPNITKFPFFYVLLKSLELLFREVSTPNLAEDNCVLIPEGKIHGNVAVISRRGDVGDTEVDNASALQYINYEYVRVHSPARVEAIPEVEDICARMEEYAKEIGTTAYSTGKHNKPTLH
jgi:hypothetical protein